MVKNTAIVLAGGSGSRMKSDIPKQYIEVEGKPLLAYSLIIMEQSPIIDEIILVARAEDLDFCREKIVNKFNISKVTHIVKGGSERFLSVYEGIKVSSGMYLWIHDGARPCLSMEILNRLYEDVLEFGATITAVPSKDTVKVIKNGFVVNTPNRADVWMVQTPQVFKADWLKDAYCNMMSDDCECNITDDAMIMENFSSEKVHVTMGEYTNIKVTTPEDILSVEKYLKKIKNTVDI